MAGLIGADVEALERLAADFDDGAQELRDLSARIAGSIEAARDWHGPDADRCKNEWGTFAQERITGVSDALATAGKLLAQNAQEQEQASGTGTAVGAAAGYGLLKLLTDLNTVKNFLMKPISAVLKAKSLVDFLKLLRMKVLGELLSSVKVAEALKVLMQGAKEGGFLAKIGLPGLGKLLGKAFLPLTAITGVVDVFTGGGYEGWRGWATRGFGLAGAAGAATLLLGGAALVASAPVTATVAAVAVTAYGLWSAGNYVVDNWGTIRDTATRAVTQVGQTAGRAWDGISSGYESAIGWARGLLGGGHRLAGAGT